MNCSHWPDACAVLTTVGRFIPNGYSKSHLFVIHLSIMLNFRSNWPSLIQDQNISGSGKFAPPTVHRHCSLIEKSESCSSLRNALVFSVLPSLCMTTCLEPILLSSGFAPVVTASSNEDVTGPLEPALTGKRPNRLFTVASPFYSCLSPQFQSTFYRRPFELHCLANFRILNLSLKSLILHLTPLRCELL